MENRKDSYDYDDLIRCGHGDLFGPGNARLPLPPMLMMDRVTHISEDGGKNGRGLVVAELDINPDLWFFACHFESDPVMPGALGLDALWQLLGFHLGWLGHPGKGRAFGVSDVKFANQVVPSVKKLTYEVHIKRVMASKLVLGIADGIMKIDGEPGYTAEGLKVGLFTEEA